MTERIAELKDGDRNTWVIDDIDGPLFQAPLKFDLPLDLVRKANQFFFFNQFFLNQFFIKSL